MADWRLALLFMMMRPSTCCAPKQPVPLEVFPSPGSNKVISFSWENGHLVKRQLVEDAKVNPLEFHDPTLGVDISSLPANGGVSQTAEDHSTGPEIDPASRSASVSMLFYHHVTVGSHDTDKTHRMVPVPSTLSQRGPPPGSSPIHYSLVYRVSGARGLLLFGLC